MKRITELKAKLKQLTEAAEDKVTNVYGNLLIDFVNFAEKRLDRLTESDDSDSLDIIPIPESPFSAFKNVVTVTCNDGVRTLKVQGFPDFECSYSPDTWEEDLRSIGVTDLSAPKSFYEAATSLMKDHASDVLDFIYFSHLMMVLGRLKLSYASPHTSYTATQGITSWKRFPLSRLEASGS